MNVECVYTRVIPTANTTVIACVRPTVRTLESTDERTCAITRGIQYVFAAESADAMTSGGDFTYDFSCEKSGSVESRDLVLHLITILTHVCSVVVIICCSVLRTCGVISAC